MTDQRTRIAADHGLIDPKSVTGWGVDADRENDPTYPYRDRDGDEGLTRNWQRPAQQRSDVEILQSIEHIRTPATFGTASPPRGASGMIRRAAFRWSESNWMHWLLLMGADRINVVEGLIEDVGRGKIPNIPAEMGARAEWQHNKKGFAVKAAVVVGLTAGAVALLLPRKSKADRQADKRVRSISERTSVADQSVSAVPKAEPAEPTPEDPRSAIPLAVN